VQYQDLADRPEDDRIDRIGEAVMQGRRVAFIVDDEPGKADRYAEKLTSRFPEVEVVAREPGFVPRTVILKAARKAPKQNGGGS
jgi:hypothetical protein